MWFNSIGGILTLYDIWVFFYCSFPNYKLKFCGNCLKYHCTFTINIVSSDRINLRQVNRMVLTEEVDISVCSVHMASQN